MTNVVLAFIAGFCVSVFAWPWLRAKINGAKGEVEHLRDELKAAEEKLKAKF